MKTIDLNLIQDLQTKVQFANDRLKEELSRLLSDHPYPPKSGYLVSAQACLDRADVCLQNALGRGKKDS
jgi:hypothetical protein